MSKLTIQLMGGLGNQLFQIFTVMAHAIRNGMEFRFQNCSMLPIGTVRPTYWDTLLDGLKPFLTHPSNLNFPGYQEPDFTYGPLPLFNHNTKLCGYFQSLKYFEPELPMILQILNIPDKIAAMRMRYSDILKDSCTSMHFRITGYRNISDCYTVAPYEYYKLAIEHMERPSRILFFHQPEDEEEVLAMIDILSAETPCTVFIQAPQELTDWEQLLLMACCDRHIIPNSTFSWWGAILSKSTKVCYPVNWFGPKLKLKLNIKDLVLPSWQGL